MEKDGWQHYAWVPLTVSTVYMLLVVMLLSSSALGDAVLVFYFGMLVVFCLLLVVGAFVSSMEKERESEKLVRRARRKARDARPRLGVIPV